MQPLLVNTSAVELATETVALLLKIDDFLMVSSADLFLREGILSLTLFLGIVSRDDRTFWKQNVHIGMAAECNTCLMLLFVCVLHNLYHECQIRTPDRTDSTVICFCQRDASTMRSKDACLSCLVWAHAGVGVGQIHPHGYSISIVEPAALRSWRPRSVVRRRTMGSVPLRLDHTSVAAGQPQFTAGVSAKCISPQNLDGDFSSCHNCRWKVVPP